MCKGTTVIICTLYISFLSLFLLFFFHIILIKGKSFMKAVDGENEELSIPLKHMALREEMYLTLAAGFLRKGQGTLIFSFNFRFIEILVFIITLKINSTCLSKLIDLYLKKKSENMCLYPLVSCIYQPLKYSVLLYYRTVVSLASQMHSTTLQKVKKKKQNKKKPTPPTTPPPQNPPA